MDIEKLGAFYLGTERAPNAGQPVMYDSRDLTTHAVCVGMTGSGKTGLCIALLEEADWDQVMDVNVKGAYLYSRAVLRSMIRAKAGHILNIGSFASERVIEAPVHYAAAKSALRGMTEALAREVGRYNIKVNVLSPGLLDCGLALMLPKHRVNEYQGQASLGRLGKAAEVAELATWMISDENSFMAAAKIVADGGL